MIVDTLINSAAITFLWTDVQNARLCIGQLLWKRIAGRRPVLALGTNFLTDSGILQVYKAVLRDTGEEVAVKVQRPGVEPVILRDLFIFRKIAGSINNLARQRLGCNAELIVDEFGEKLLEELDYQQEARNIAVCYFT